MVRLEPGVPLQNVANHHELTSVAMDTVTERFSRPKISKKHYVGSLSGFFQDPVIVVSMARECLPRGVLESILSTASRTPMRRPYRRKRVNNIDVSQFVTEEREQQVKAALMNALPKYLAYVNNELRLIFVPSDSSLIRPQPADGVLEVFARRMQALLNLRDMSMNDSKSLMDDWCDYFLQDEIVEQLVKAELGKESKVVQRAVKESLPAYARTSMWVEIDGSESTDAVRQAPRLAGSRFRRLWLLWMKHYDSAAAPQSVATALMQSFADVVQAHMAAGNPASDMFDSESLAFSFDQTPNRFEGTFTSLVDSLWDAMVALHKECLDEAKAVFIEEIRAAIHRARTRKCCLWVSQSGIFWIILTMLGAGITVLDQVTDVMLGVEHVLDGNPAWGVLTFFFAILPSALQGSLMIRGTCLGRMLGRYRRFLNRVYRRLFNLCEHHDRKCSRGAPRTACVVLLLFYVVAIGLFVLIPLWTPPLILFASITPILGMLFVMKWSWLYFRQPDTRTVLEANLRAYGIMETLLESVPQLLLQLYIYSIQGELQRL